MPPVSRLVLVALLGVALLGVARPALAERADRDQPVNLEADRVTVDQARQRSVYSGQVVLTQGTLSLRADRVEVSQTDGGVSDVTATGQPAAFRQRMDDTGEWLEGQAARLVYNSQTSTLNMVGQAKLTRGGDVLRGERITYDAANGTYQVVGGSDAGTPGGRVRATLMPKTRRTQP